MKRILLSILFITLAACGERDAAGPNVADEAGKPIVIASNYPLFFFAGEIADDAVDVRMPDIEGDPAMWVPGGEEAGLLQQADLLLINGAGYESWLAFTTLPAGLILDTTAHVQDRLLPIESATVHQHGPEGEHSHQGTAFTTWLDPQLAIEQARAIERGISELVPGHADAFRSNLEVLEGRLKELDRSLAGLFDNLGDQPVVFSHPVYQYLQRRYAINARSVHWEPDTNPGTREWVDFNNLLRKNPARLMIWEDKPLMETAERLSEIGVTTVVFAPAGNRPASGNYFQIMSQNIRQVKNAITNIEQ